MSMNIREFASENGNVMTMRNGKKIDAFLPALWESLNKSRKRKFAEVMTEPIILPSADDRGWVPEWMFKSLENERVERALDLRPELTEFASDLEASMYLMCGTFHTMLSEQACRIYFDSASRLNEPLREAMLSEELISMNGQLSSEDEDESRRFKKWIRAQQKNGKNAGKVNRFISVCDNALFEMKNADLLVLESQI